MISEGGDFECCQVKQALPVPNHDSTEFALEYASPSHERFPEINLDPQLRPQPSTFKLTQPELLTTMVKSECACIHRRRVCAVRCDTCAVIRRVGA